MIRLVVSGACGKMGRAMLEKIALEEDVQVISAVDVMNTGKKLHEFVYAEKYENINIEGNLAEVLSAYKPDVMLDFTTPKVVYNNIMLALQQGVSPVVGTTGLTAEQLEDISHLAREKKLGAFIAPNFAIGAVLLMQLATQAAKYMSSAEIIELHHDQKIDAPSGTALKTALAMEPYINIAHEDKKEMEIIPGSRGGLTNGIRVHSVRLPGFVAHQEVIFGALGQTLTLRHDSISRESFYPGVILAIRKVKTFTGLKIGLETIME